MGKGLSRMSDKELADRDMYGHTIHRIGDTDFGISITIDSTGKPSFALFEKSDNFQQAFCLVDYVKGWDDFSASGFQRRIAESWGKD